MTTSRRTFITACLLLLSLASAFTVNTPLASTTARQSSLNAMPPPFFMETSQTMAAATVDPNAALSNALGNFIGSPAILAIPIVAALGVASLIAFLIVAYAQPAADDDDEY